MTNLSRRHVILMCGMFCVCAATHLFGADRADLIKHLSNDDLEWNGGPFGLTVKLSKRAKEVVSELTEEDVVTLQKYTKDARRFAVAHIILGGVFFPNEPIGSDKYLVLDITLDKDGVSFPDYSPDRLSLFWKETIEKNRSEINDLLKKMRGR